MAKQTPKIQADNTPRGEDRFFQADTPPVVTVDRTPTTEPVVVRRQPTDWELTHSRWTAHYPNQLLAELDQAVAAAKAAGEKGVTKNRVAVQWMQLGRDVDRGRA